MAGADIPRPRLICIVGPTGVGKTAMALELAGRWGGEIVSADSMQVYRHMDIGTAKPTPEERRRIPHHLLDVVNPDEPFDASLYIRLANGIIADLQRERKVVFVVGGTGLYIRALLGGLIDGPGADEVLRRELKQQMNQRGKAHLYERLRTTDPLAADQIHPHDGIRIIRALEVLELTGRSIVAHQQEHRFGEAPYELLRIGLCLDRERLNDRIERRTDRMIADGLPEEVRRLLDMGYTESLKPMQSLGYRNMISFLAGQQSLEEAVRLIKRDTCRYAKRQMTWFAADREVVWLDPGDVDAASKRIDLFLNCG
ncbi:MAG: tRNA (adenosine(37)-N6)-dimethylallyltransferase MiaA [Deltaproteobacteria bacterium]|nr:MAG: tRNA (adenosine(37)-N6)-dimethylallyltransferase MiaA [Deltaproteobacteria bacterium]